MSQRTAIVSRSFLLSNSLGLAIAAVSCVLTSSALTSPALAQNADTVIPTADIETSAYTFAGEVNSDVAVVRSGPSENDYPTLKLAKGAKLVVVGYRFDWLKVEPPEGSFCLVSQAFVDKRGDGTVGRIATQRATVRVGSALTLSKHKVPMQLEPGTEVKIVGEVDEYYKITPPKGVYMYVDKKFVNPVRKLDDNAAANANNGKPAEPSSTLVPPDSSRSTVSSDGAVSSTSTGDSSTTTPPAVTTTPQSAQSTNGDGRFVVSSGETTISEAAGSTATRTPPEVATPTNPTSVQKLQERLATLEDSYAAAAQKDITEQPIDQLLTDYTALLADEQLPPNARKVAEYRTNALKLRKETLEQFLATKKMQAEIAVKQQDLKVEQEELQTRVAETSVKRYAAIGRLVQSSLQVGGQTLYRLVDPATSRTIIYVRTSEKPLGDSIDKFVAIEGQVVADEAARLTYVQPKNFEIVDPKQVNVKFFADFSPPSLAAQTVAGESPSPQ